ncbi:hypothetical protein VAA_02762 [Vibrio anguillarum 775]|nr:hypothetical protein VAA_02762 [Vibrio anguillarum 775]
MKAANAATVPKRLLILKIIGAVARQQENEAR